MMYNKSFAMYLLLSVDYKRKERLITGFPLCYLVRKKIVTSLENLDNSTYNLPDKAKAL